MNNGNFSRDDMMLGGVAILLIIDLIALPWFSIGGGSIGNVSFPSVSLTATDAPDGWLGVLALLAVIAVIVDLGIERLSPQTQVPAIGANRTMTRFVLAAAGAAFLALKFLFHIGSFSSLGFGFWAAVVLTAGLVFVALQARNAQPVRPTTPVGPAGPAGPPAV